MIIRIGLLGLLGWILSLEKELFNLKNLGLPIDEGFSGKDLILFFGGLFLLFKATSEIHHKVEGKKENQDSKAASNSFNKALVDITLINLVFSVDSIITAIGMTKIIGVMAASIILSTLVMMLFAKNVGDFVEKHPTIKMLALSFLVLIGTILIAEAFHVHVPKGYIYFAMAFSFLVEILNIRMRKNKDLTTLGGEDSYSPIAKN
jgi:predicted tellurium resistance membrane protein TerC